MLLTTDLNFEYPQELVATQAVPRGHSRILAISRDRPVYEEISWSRFLAGFKSGDSLVLNDTKVLWARLLITKASGSKGEIFFLRSLTDQSHWEVLSRAMNLKDDKEITLPGGIKARVIKADRVSEIRLQAPVDLAEYFEKHGHVPLPPYIVSLRKNSESDDSDRERYQTVWAKNWGSVAAPTAGLHFTDQHLEELRERGVRVSYVTLHVGAGTFLPIETEKLDDFKIHPEWVSVSRETCENVLKSQAAGRKVWACGTTALRALESAVWGSGTGGTNMPMIAPFQGMTDLFITPGYKFQVVDGLLTNFHQPQSSLLALVAAFATRMPVDNKSDAKQAVKKIIDAYHFAMERKFRLFSYGDLTVIT